MSKILERERIPIPVEDVDASTCKLAQQAKQVLGYSALANAVTKKEMTVFYFHKRFPIPGHNFQSRLEQIKTILPDAVDWEIVDVEPKLAPR